MYPTCIKEMLGSNIVLSDGELINHLPLMCWAPQLSASPVALTPDMTWFTHVFALLEGLLAPKGNVPVCTKNIKK